MSVAIPFHKHTVGRTFMISVSVLGIGALMQFGAMCWLFFTRYRTGPEYPVAAVNSVPGAVRDFSDPFADSTPAAANLPNITPPKPTPVLQLASRAPEAVAPDRLAEQIEQGKMLRERGDTYAAVTKFLEAETMAEQNPQPTAELALTYEKMGFTEKAAESWKRIYDMGPAAGIYYSAAEAKLKVSQATATKEATTVDPPPASTAGATTSAPGKGEGGINANCKLWLLDITREDQTDAGAKKKFVLKVPVKAKSRARIDTHDVIVQVVFYDLVNGKALDRTNATVSYKWSRPPADWSDDDVEMLEVNYLLPELRVTDEDRKYYGYITSLYYKNALQDFRSDPPAIAQKVPPPVALAQDPQ